MSQRNCIPIIIILLFWSFGCSHVNYVGKSYEPTKQVEVFYSEEEIEKEYSVIGHAISGGQILVSTDKLQKKLIQKAMTKGADAILITGIGRDTNSDGRGFDAEKQIKANFLKYN